MFLPGFIDGILRQGCMRHSSGEYAEEGNDRCLMKVVATFRSEHDGNSDKAILLSGLAPEPALSREWCVTDLIIAGVMKVERPQHLHRVRHKMEAQVRKGLCDAAICVVFTCTCNIPSQSRAKREGTRARHRRSTCRMW